MWHQALWEIVRFETILFVYHLQTQYRLASGDESLALLDTTNAGSIVYLCSIMYPTVDNC